MGSRGQVSHGRRYEPVLSPRHEAEHRGAVHVEGQPLSAGADGHDRLGFHSARGLEALRWVLPGHVLSYLANHVCTVHNYALKFRSSHSFGGPDGIFPPDMKNFVMIQTF